jgi:hypothetical protein
VIAGSTRLKAGTATKMVLNMLTTASMIRIGKTYGNLMVDVQMGSEKLRDRARRIVAIVTGLEYEQVDSLLRRAHWNVKAAIVMQKSGLPYPRAVSRLRRAHDFVRDAIGEDVEPRLRELLDGHERIPAPTVEPREKPTREKLAMPGEVRSVPRERRTTPRKKSSPPPEKISTI